MPIGNLPKKVIIIGAGISGVTAARELRKLGVNAADITFLEKESQVGGKLKTYTDPMHPELKTEYGAGVLTHNYGIDDVMREHHIQPEVLLPTRSDTIEFQDKISKLSFPSAVAYFGKFTWQLLKFAKQVWSYNAATISLQETPPRDLEMPFTEYAKKYQLNDVVTFLKFITPGFGYGAMDNKNCYAYRMLAYMGYATIPGLCLSGMVDSLVAMHGGYQQLVEKMTSDFAVQTAVLIQSIDRQRDAVKVKYNQNGQEHEIEADLLVVTTSPLAWRSFGMDLTQAENDCVDNLSFYRYPVAICKLKGVPAKQFFIREALEADGFGHAAFLFTRDKRDNPEDGRLFTVYINMPPGNNNFSFAPDSEDYKTLIADLKKAGATDVNFLDGKVWEDYNVTIPWKNGIGLQREELLKATRTIHLGAYLPGSFETVAGTVGYAKNAIDRYFNSENSTLRKGLDYMKHSWQFFMLPRALPYQPSEAEELALTRVTPT